MTIIQEARKTGRLKEWRENPATLFHCVSVQANNFSAIKSHTSCVLWGQTALCAVVEVERDLAERGMVTFLICASYLNVRIVWGHTDQMFALRLRSSGTVIFHFL